MANQEQLTLLKTSITEWNKWRKAQVHILPDLSKADLKGVNLKGADLTLTNLREADLSEADLSEANVSKSSIMWD